MSFFLKAFSLLKKIVYSFTQINSKISLKYLPCARCFFRCWGYINEQQSPYYHGAYIIIIYEDKQ